MAPIAAELYHPVVAGGGDTGGLFDGERQFAIDIVRDDAHSDGIADAHVIGNVFDKCVRNFRDVHETGVRADVHKGAEMHHASHSALQLLAWLQLLGGRRASAHAARDATGREAA